MAHTEILPASAMKSPVNPNIPVSNLGWTQVPGTASAVAAAPDGSLWALSDQPSSSADKYIWHYSGGTWTNISGLASQLTVAADGSLWALNSGGGIWHYSGGTWTSPGGGATNSITADSSGGVYVLSNGGAGPDRAIWHYSTGSGWVQQNGSGTALAANWDTNSFSAGSINPGGFYILNSAGGIWYENSNGNFATLPGAASAITPTTNGGVFVLGYPTSPSGNQVYYFDLNSPGWTAQNGAGLLSISAGPSALYLTSSSGTIFSAALPQFGAAATATITGPSSSASSSVTIGTPVTIPLTVVEKDVNGKTITGTYATPVALTNIDPTGSTSLNVSSVGSSTTSVTLTYNGSSAFAGTFIRARLNNVRVSAFELTGPCTLAAGAVRGTGTGNNTNPASIGYYPCDLQSAYNLSSSSASNGSGQTVAIVDAYDDPTAESDLAVYRATFGLPACTSGNGCFTKRAQNGSTSYPSADAGWAGEIALDLDMVSAICPNCHILLVEATNNSNLNLYTAENEAVVLGATEISNSWGGGESTIDPGSETTYFNHPGVPITASTGDDGFIGPPGVGSGVSFPASSQYVTAVGGTRLLGSGSTRGWVESAWSGAGSGCSARITKPIWQKDTQCTFRMLADVSADADPNTGVLTYNTYQSFGWGIIGGTSESSPIIASVYAISGNASTVVYGSYPYLNQGFIYDITTGSNDTGDPTCGGNPTYYCNAGTGYDGPTGLGTPNGATGSFIRTLENEAGPPSTTRLIYPPAPSRRLCPDERRAGYAACYAIERTDN